MFSTRFDGKYWAVSFEEKVLVDGLSEKQAMTLWENLDDLLEEFLSLEDSELTDD